MVTEAYWTPREFAEVFDLDKDTVYRSLKEGEIAGAFRIGRQWRIVKAAFYASLSLKTPEEHSEAGQG